VVGISRSSVSSQAGYKWARENYYFSNINRVLLEIEIKTSLMLDYRQVNSDPQNSRFVHKNRYVGLRLVLSLIRTIVQLI